MKIRPIIRDSVYTRHTSFVVDFRLDWNITFIQGDSGVGKSAVFSFLQELAAEDKTVRCFNYLDLNKSYRLSLRNSKGKLFVIDNADLLLNDKMRGDIAMDDRNQYILFGRNPTGLLLTSDEIYELNHTVKDGKTVFTLKKSF